MPNETTCTRCNGTGTYTGTRRDGSSYTGPCFGCQGFSRYTPNRDAYRRAFGVIPAATQINERSDVTVIAAPMSTAPRGERNWNTFAMQHPAEAAWLQSPAAGDFGASLIAGCKRYGGLTMRQMAAVQRNLQVSPAPSTMDAADVACHERAAAASMPAGLREFVARADARASALVGATPEGVPVTEQDVSNGAQVTLSSMVDAMRRPAQPAPITIPAAPVRTAMEAAAASGLRKVRLVLGAVTFKLSGERFRNGGRGMILCYEAGSYAGYIDRADVFHTAQYRTVTDAMLTAFRSAAIDPQAAARTYGQDTGRCGCCQRLLTDPPSVMAGIGPICIQRFGW